MAWFAVVLGLVVLGLVLYWLLITTEGVYLGRRLVVWLYDITAHKYDGIKEFDTEVERFTIIRPFLHVLVHKPSLRVLDVATGTGRVPFLLLQERTFRGWIAGLDASGHMLAKAAAKLEPFGRRVFLIQQTAVPLPFAGESFDAVFCLEALEFFPSDEAALREMARVLRPGGFLLTSRRCGWEGKAFLGRYRPAGEFEALLQSLGLTQVQCHVWQVGYDLVSAVKAGELSGP